MSLNIINQLCFARSEFRKGFSGVSDEDGYKRLGPINSIGWIVGHLAWHEQYYWLQRAQNTIPIPELNDIVGFNKPASQPPLSDMVDAWEKVASACDPYLHSLYSQNLEEHMFVREKELPFNIGTMISRVIYHYWYHNGEIQAIRQMLGHTNLPDFVSDDIETIGSFYLDR